MNTQLRIAVIPGSFDPVTNGHLDIIKRTSVLFDKVYVSILENSTKNPLFTVDERKDLLRRTTSALPNVTVDSFSGLLVNYMEQINSFVIVKGLRAVSDFEYEFQMALTNRKLNPQVETLFMTTNDKYSYLSSSIVKEVAKFGGSLKDLVPEEIMPDIYKKLNITREV